MQVVRGIRATAGRGRNTGAQCEGGQVHKKETGNMAVIEMGNRTLDPHKRENQVTATMGGHGTVPSLPELTPSEHFTKGFQVKFHALWSVFLLVPYMDKALSRGLA